MTKIELSIFDYFDSNVFIKAYIEKKQLSNPQYSGRLLLQKAGIKSSGFLSELLSDKRKLSSSNLEKMILALNLNNKESLYFKNLVLYKQAKTSILKQDYFDNLLEIAPQKNSTLLKKHKELFENWYTVAARETLTILNIQDLESGAKLLSKLITPSVTTIKIKKSLKLLESLNLISKDQQQYWKPTNQSIFSSGPKGGDINSIRSFQSQMMKLATDHLEITPPEERTTLSSTMSISQEGMERIQHFLTKMQKNLINLIESDENEDRIYQFNLQFFPLTNPLKEEITND
ncbi:TIGR02147 family protein [Fibrobacterales bacterium]|nr:TIGR02147 family protein [Fibrobacterales bacterium]